MSQVFSKATEAILPVYLTKVGKPLFEGLNQTKEDWLRLPPYGTGPKIIYWKSPFDRLPLFQLKLRSLRGYFRVDDTLLTNSKEAAILKQAFEDGLKSLHRTHGYMALPRNYYFPETAEVFVYSQPWNDTVLIGWKIMHVVMPRGWRKKLYRARKLAGRKLPK